MDDDYLNEVTSARKELNIGQEAVPSLDSFLKKSSDGEESNNILDIIAGLEKVNDLETYDYEQIVDLKGTKRAEETTKATNEENKLANLLHTLKSEKHPPLRDEVQEKATSGMVDFSPMDQNDKKDSFWWMRDAKKVMKKMKPLKAESDPVKPKQRLDQTEIIANEFSSQCTSDSPNRLKKWQSTEKTDRPKSKSVASLWLRDACAAAGLPRSDKSTADSPQGTNEFSQLTRGRRYK